MISEVTRCSIKSKELEMYKIIGVVLASLAFPVFAITTAPNSIPEPNALALLGIGAVAGLLVWAKNRKK